MTLYANGMAFQRRVRTHLETDGYHVVQAGGSRGIADLVAIKTGQTLLIQVKLSNGQLAPKDRAELYELAAKCGALPIVAHRSRPRGPIAFRLLTGAGPKNWQPWVADEVAVA